MQEETSPANADMSNNIEAGGHASETQQPPSGATQGNVGTGLPESTYEKRYNDLRGSFDQTTYKLSQLEQRYNDLANQTQGFQDIAQTQEKLRDVFVGKQEVSEEDQFYLSPLEYNKNQTQQMVEMATEPLRQELDQMKWERFETELKSQIQNTRAENANRYTEDAVLQIETQIKQWVDPYTGTTTSGNGFPYWLNLVNTLPGGYDGVFNLALGQAHAQNNEALMRGYQTIEQQRREQAERRMYTTGAHSGSSMNLDPNYDPTDGIVSFETVQLKR